uniref:NADH-ubiquinone oxidoreductase chain 2 n=1 Tax=Xantusia sp. Yucca Valley TaxID=488636 RepID=A9YAG1_9SAUR|nr:NADH dehydrogenase subunit 2 [Xantusia sp. Yucca Valley]
MSPIIQSLILSSLATGTIITMTSQSWILAWVGLEINTLAILPIISKNHHPRATEAMTKYFLTQVAASTMILFASTLNAWHSGQWSIMQLTTEPASTVLTLALAMKLGLAPAHFWLPEVMQGSTIMTAMILTTWQKLAPMTILIMTHQNLPTTILLMIGLISSLWGGWAGLNQTQLRKILAYSSIAHLGWIYIAISMDETITILTLLIYILLTSLIFLSMNTSHSKTMKDMSTTWTLSPTLTTFMLLTLLSLGGLPPLTGFLPKWLILQELTAHHLSPIATFLAFSTLLSLFFYLRLSYTTTITLHPNPTTMSNKWRQKKYKHSKLISTLLPITTIMIPMSPIML